MRPRIQSQMFNPRIKRSIATLSTLLSLAIQANASGATGLVNREDASSPYILESYSCDLSRLKRREDGSTFGRVQTSPNSIALAVTPESHEAVLFTGDRAFQSYFENSPKIKNMRSKVKKFEDEGNIPAMKHWDEKLRAELLYKKHIFANPPSQSTYPNKLNIKACPYITSRMEDQSSIRVSKKWTMIIRAIAISVYSAEIFPTGG